jgi:LuxR family maltose regulon positive regulatory protein
MEQPKRVRRERRIIERPRLIKMLDECEARVILLLAPAGYGKTTLARQWAKTLNSAIWVGATPAHRDVATLAEDIALGIDRIGGEATRVIREHLTARSNPQRAAREIGLALAERLAAVKAQWLVIDDYQELFESEEVQELIAAMFERAPTRLLFASRLRPPWATSRRLLYGEIAEVGREELAMTPEECELVLERRPNMALLARQAQGWPAVIALASAVGATSPPRGSLPDTLYRYLAEELFQMASPDLRNHVVTLALLGDTSSMALEHHLGKAGSRLTDEARDLGFLTDDRNSQLHPLLQEFLLTKLLDEPDAEERVRAAVSINLSSQCWDRALELVLRFNLFDLVASTLETAYKPLVRSGRLGTLSTFARAASSAPTFPPAVVEVAQAEVAQRDGQHQLAVELGRRVRDRLSDGHQLRSRAEAIIGHSSFLLGDFSEAEFAFGEARRHATDERDETEAIHGLALARIFGERSGATEAVKELEIRRHRSPTDLVRFATAELSRRRFAEGLGAPLHLEEAQLALTQVEDPRARTALAYGAASAFAQRADYEEAKAWLQILFADAETFGLEFAIPFAVWTGAQVSLGLRRFGDAERSIQSVEDIARRTNDDHHRLNANVLRARLLLQTNNGSDALELLRTEPAGRLIPSWRGEFLGTRALVLARLGQPEAALIDAAQAETASASPEVKFFGAAVRTIIGLRESPEEAGALVLRSEQTGIWDPMVCALRAIPELAEAAALDPIARPILERLYRRTNDLSLARRAGFRTRSTKAPTEVLSPRELEVLGLIARGLRNREIAGALYIAESTTKVHVRHVLEKLGVRTRAEAVARHEMFNA